MAKKKAKKSRASRRPVRRQTIGRTEHTSDVGCLLFVLTHLYETLHHAKVLTLPDAARAIEAIRQALERQDQDSTQLATLAKMRMMLEALQQDSLRALAEKLRLN